MEEPSARSGFNVQWMLVDPGRRPPPADERALDFMASNGFDFLRVPTDYRVWTTGFDYLHPDRSVFDFLDGYLEACRSRGIHLSLNLHRAPGYCITRIDLERDRLWIDQVAQDAFVFLWEGFARRYRGVPGAQLSFDLVNEPPAIGQDGFTRDIHAALIRRTVTAIRAIDPDRPLVIDGVDGGNLAMPELADLGVTHSTRGYAPYPVSHWGATWWDGWRLGDAPRWPGVVYEGRAWTKDDLREFYDPWRAVERAGAAFTSASSAATARRPTLTRCAGSATCSTSSTSSDGASRSGTSRARSASSATAVPGLGSSSATATWSTWTCSSSSWAARVT